MELLFVGVDVAGTIHARDKNFHTVFGFFFQDLFVQLVVQVFLIFSVKCSHVPAFCIQSENTQGGIRNLLLLRT